MVNVVVIVTMVSDYLVKTALQGQPSSIDFLCGIFIIRITNCFYQLLFISQCCIVQTMYGSEKPKSNRLTSGELAECV